MPKGWTFMFMKSILNSPRILIKIHYNVVVAFFLQKSCLSAMTLQSGEGIERGLKMRNIEFLEKFVYIYFPYI